MTREDLEWLNKHCTKVDENLWKYGVEKLGEFNAFILYDENGKNDCVWRVYSDFCIFYDNDEGVIAWSTSPKLAVRKAMKILRQKLYSAVRKINTTLSGFDKMFCNKDERV